MRFPKLTPLQSRLAASALATVLLVIVWLGFAPRTVAYAAELRADVSFGAEEEDHNHEWIPAARRAVDDERGRLDWADAEDEEEVPLMYEPEFQVGVDRSVIGRAAAGVDAIFNNVKASMNLSPNATSHFVFSNSTLWGNHTEKGPGLPNPLVYVKHSTKRSVVVPRSEGQEGEAEEEWDGLEEVWDENGTATGKVRKRQSTSEDSRTVWITINTCSQPQPNGTTSADPPQLTMYVSQSKSNQKPGPNSGSSAQVARVLDEGFGNYTLNASSDVYIGVSAPELPSNYSGIWTFEIAASIDGPYHAYNWENPFLFLVDSDSDSALLVTDNLTDANSTPEIEEEWMSIRPFSMFAFPANNTAVRGLNHSYCGLSQIAAAGVQVERGMTRRGLGDKPKEQFQVTGLNASTSYVGFLAMYGNSTKAGPDVAGGAVVGGGGQVWTQMYFSTKADDNCQVIYNLTFCSEVAYAVPANPSRIPSDRTLADLYDNYAAALYQNFNYSLQQIPCNTTNTAQYSLARTCTDCARDYKTWLCAVTIPRCEDFSATAAYLQPRNVGQPFLNGSAFASSAYARQYLNASALDSKDNSSSNPSSNPSISNAHRLYANQSRNPLIDSAIAPGPYKEVLPCQDLCYSIVQSCPAALGFACPLPGKGLEYSYGVRSDDPSRITCSYLGAVYYLNPAPARPGPPSVGWGLLVCLLVVVVVVVVG